MQTFINPLIPTNEPGHVWQFNDDVHVEVSTVIVGEHDNPTTEERRQFFAPHGAKLNVPDTLVPGEIPGPTLDDLKAAKISTLSGDCKAAIVSGFDSNALGTWHTYPMNQTDQLNLASSVLDSLLPGIEPDWTTPFWCADEEGLWLFRLHTAEQIQKVGRDAKAAVLACMSKNATLAQQVRNAETAEDVADIKWQAPVHADL